MRVVSCIPEQTYSYDDKWKWLDNAMAETKPDIFVTPQEYLGGVQAQFFQTGEPLHWPEETIIEPALALCRKYDSGMFIGALVFDEKLQQVRERIYGIDPEHGVTGYVDKWALPAYDDIRAKATTRVNPELNFENRARTITVKGARVGVLFCWEVYSNFMWHFISRSSPDFVVSMIKFGVKGWPQKAKDPKTKESLVTGFGFGGDGGWIDRLRFASTYDIAAPIVCSTNSWDLPKKAAPLVGTIYPFTNHESTMWYPGIGLDTADIARVKQTLEDAGMPEALIDEQIKPLRAARRAAMKGTIEEKIIIDEINPLEWRYARENKYKYNEMLNDWPDSKLREYTMLWKIKRMERKTLGITAEDHAWVEPKDNLPAAQTTLFGV